MENKLPTIGFLGSGAITTAMVTGLCERAAGAPYPLVVSDTKAEACEKLRAKFPGRSRRRPRCRSVWISRTGS